MRKLTHAELVIRQENQIAQQVPLVVILNDIRSLYNVGSIFRTADGAGVKKVWLCGITGFPPDNQITKTALGAEKSVAWEYERDPCNVIQQLKMEGYRILLLEQMESSIAYQDYDVTGPVCLVLGNEISGVSERLVSLCDGAVDIEMSGLKNSLNVSVAFGIVAYHLKNGLQKISQPTGTV